MTRQERDRNYHVLMYAIDEENRIMKLPNDVLQQRMKDAWESCYGDLPEYKQRGEHKGDAA